MALNFNSIMLGSPQPEVLTEFYGKIFDKAPDMSDGGFTGWLVGQGFWSIGPHDEVKGKNEAPGRILLNLEAEDVRAEFERVKATGAEVVQEPYHPGDDDSMLMATFADPDGNYFQLASPWEA